MIVAALLPLFVAHLPGEPSGQFLGPLLVPAPALAEHVPSAPDADDPLHGMAPADTFAWIQTTAHVPLAEQGLDHPWLAKALESPLVKAEFTKRGVDPVAALEAATAALDVSPFDLVSGLASRGIAVGLVPGIGSEPRPFAILRGSDADAFEDALDPLIDALSGFNAIREIAAEQGKALGDRLQAAWKVGDGAAYAAAFDDQTIIIATNLGDLAACARRSNRAKGLAAGRAGMDSVGDTFGWLDLDIIELGGELGDLRAMPSDPGTHFVLGPVLTYFGSASSLAFDVDLTADAISARIRADGIRAGKGAASFPGEGRIAPRCPKPAASEVGRMHLYRDMETLLDLRTDLFVPQTLPGLAEGIAGTALILGGPDAVEEVIDAIDPHWLFLSDLVEFDAAAAPDVQLPSATGVFHLENAEVNGIRLVQAFQSLISLQNVERAMQGQPGFLLSLRAVGEHTMTLAALPAPRPGDSVDITYNFAPACAAVGDFFVIGTHHGPVASAVDRISKGQLQAAPTDTLDRASVSAQALTDLVASNRDILQMKAMFEEGKTKVQAVQEIDTLLVLLRTIHSLEFETVDPGPVPASLKADAPALEARITIRLLP